MEPEKLPCKYVKRRLSKPAVTYLELVKNITVLKNKVS
jgi:hypothetical protein